MTSPISSKICCCCWPKTDPADEHKEYVRQEEEVHLPPPTDEDDFIDPEYAALDPDGAKRIAEVNKAVDGGDANKAADLLRQHLAQSDAERDEIMKVLEAKSNEVDKRQLKFVRKEKKKWWQ